jgi:hypothetical protein
MNLPEIVNRAKSSSFHLWLLNTGLWYKIPFNHPHKPRITKIDGNVFTILLPYKRKNRNHIKGIHACALATLCEYISGLVLVNFLSEKDHRIILKNIHMTYHYQAKMDVETTFSLAPEFIQNEIEAPLKSSDSVFKELTVNVYDVHRNHICTGVINWQIKKWEKVKTKIV